MGILRLGLELEKKRYIYLLKVGQRMKVVINMVN